MKKGHAAVFLFQASSNTTQAEAKGDASLQQDNRVLVLTDQSTRLRNDISFLFFRCLPFMGSDKSVMTRTMRSFVHEKEQRLRPVSHLLKPCLVHAGQSRSRLTCSSPPSSPPSLSSSLASSSASSPASNWVVHSSVGCQPCHFTSPHLLDPQRPIPGFAPSGK